ncbi:hypothetical protein RCL_jg1723.t1 [Rhizophagus clarus]|uniref:Uncharacterized protein n=1 Tax=Rhizophagus clarus TaxID=94130 RepID=A0A8H3QJN7_9GLOM|nr:hypothetical protein RCL_jg1723.t1 [Rhizophagus clarus]
MISGIGYLLDTRVLDFRIQDQWKVEIKEYLSERLDADFWPLILEWKVLGTISWPSKIGIKGPRSRVTLLGKLYYVAIEDLRRGIRPI